MTTSDEKITTEMLDACPGQVPDGARDGALALELVGVSKRFKLYHDPARGPLKEWLFWWRKSQFSRELPALEGVSFSVRRGETVGVIGANGAGKTTLLKIIGGLLEPDAGRVTVRGRVTTMLALGLAVHPEFTGRENVLYNGLLMGMSKDEVLARLPEIVRFAELEDYVDHPFRTYSTGMRARLLFATATAVKPDIIIIDEALATGDLRFLQKCRQRIQQLCESGATVLFVSHSLAQVQEMTRRSLVIHGGQLAFDGPTEAAIAHYVELVQREEERRFEQEERRATAAVGNAATGSATNSSGPRDRTEVDSAAADDTVPTSSNVASSVAPPTPRQLGTGEVELLDVGWYVDGERSTSIVVGEPCELRIRVRAERPLPDSRFCVWIRSEKSVTTYAFLPPIPDLIGAGAERYNAVDLPKGESVIRIAVPRLVMGDGGYACDLSIYPPEAEFGFTPDRAYCHAVNVKRFRAMYRDPQYYGRWNLAEVPVDRIEVVPVGVESASCHTRTAAA